MTQGHMSNKTILPLIDRRGYETLSRDGQRCQRWNRGKEAWRKFQRNVFVEREKTAKAG